MGCRGTKPTCRRQTGRNDHVSGGTTAIVASNSGANQGRGPPDLPKIRVDSVPSGILHPTVSGLLHLRCYVFVLDSVGFRFVWVVAPYDHELSCRLFHQLSPKTGTTLRPVTELPVHVSLVTVNTVA